MSVEMVECSPQTIQETFRKLKERFPNDRITSPGGGGAWRSTGSIRFDRKNQAARLNIYFGDFDTKPIVENVFLAIYTDLQRSPVDWDYGGETDGLADSFEEFLQKAEFRANKGRALTGSPLTGSPLYAPLEDAYGILSGNLPAKLEHWKLHTGEEEYAEAKKRYISRDPIVTRSGEQEIFRFNHPVNFTLDPDQLEIGPLRFFNFAVIFYAPSRDETDLSKIFVTLVFEFHWAKRKTSFVSVGSSGGPPLNQFIERDWHLMPSWQARFGKNPDSHGFIYFREERSTSRYYHWQQISRQVREEVVALFDKCLEQNYSAMAAKIKEELPQLAKYFGEEHYGLHTGEEEYAESKLTEAEFLNLPGEWEAEKLVEELQKTEIFRDAHAEYEGREVVAYGERLAGRVAASMTVSFRKDNKEGVYVRYGYTRGFGNTLLAGDWYPIDEIPELPPPYNWEHAVKTHRKRLGAAYNELWKVWTEALQKACERLEHWKLHTGEEEYAEAHTLKEAKEVYLNSGLIDLAFEWARQKPSARVKIDDREEVPDRQCTFKFYAPGGSPEVRLVFSFHGSLDPEVSEEKFYKISVAYATYRANYVGIIDIAEGSEDYPIPETWEEVERDMERKYAKHSGFMRNIRRLSIFPEIKETYEDFMAKLFPAPEHWGLHTGEEEYAEARQWLAIGKLLTEAHADRIIGLPPP